MYSTVKEIHVAIISKLNQINSNRKRTFRPEELDEAFNNTMLKFIEERSLINNTDVGLLENVKRYDDLKDLNNDFIDSIYYKDNKLYFMLPYDYIKFESLTVSTVIDCKRNEFDTEDVTMSIQILKFNTPTVASDYSTFKITDATKSTDIYETTNYGLDNLSNVDSKFMIVNSVLNVLNNNLDGNDYEVFWENFGNLRFPNSFIFTSRKTSASNYTLLVGSTTTNSFDSSETFKTFITTDADILTDVDTELVSTKIYRDIKQNYYMNKKRWKKPLIQLKKHLIEIDYHIENGMKIGELSYIKSPILINLKAGIMTDFVSHIDQIIDLTVTHLSLILTGDVQATASISTNNTQ